MPFEIPQLESTGFIILKIAAIVGMALYVVFAFVVLKQVNIMTQTLEVNFEKPLRIAAALHLFTAILVFIYSIIM
ncbi:MAG TPA: DUF5657 family protein [Patescibacteria group bacterium]|nr:DUF5657 family protein [Patescibacteria group bacterium]